MTECERLMRKPPKPRSVTPEELLGQLQKSPLVGGSSALTSNADQGGGEISSESQEITTLLRSILEWAVELLGVESGEVYLYDIHVQALKLSVVCGPMDRYFGVTLQPGEGLAGKVFASREPILVEDYNHWIGRAPKFKDRFPYQTELAVPLQWLEQIIGVLSIVSDRRKRPLTEADIHPTLVCANLVAAAIENARLYQELQNSLKQLKHTLEQEVVDRTNAIARQAALAVGAGMTRSNTLSGLNTDELLASVIELSTTKKVLTHITQMPFEAPSLQNLTAREMQILILIGRGYSNKEIASELKLAVSTVKFHVGSLFSKLNLHDRIQAALWSVRMGLVKQEKNNT
jgi:DNA-binding NarL/FixJ family response regulator